jgi:hypothetical protein
MYLLPSSRQVLLHPSCILACIHADDDDTDEDDHGVVAVGEEDDDVVDSR